MTSFALIISHGQPSEPEPAAAENRALAAQVQAHLPGWRVLGPTLAEPGALEAAVAEAGIAEGGTGAAGAGLVYPMFMTDGWFTQDHLPKRLAAAGGHGFSQTAPFGLDPRVHALAISMVQEASAGGEAASELLLAAHGSFRSPRPAAVAEAVARQIGAALALGRADAAFIDQEPRLAGVTGYSDRAICLPFFAAAGGHVMLDLPQALEVAGFTGRVLPPLGCDPRVPGLIAQSLIRAASQLPN